MRTRLLSVRSACLCMLFALALLSLPTEANADDWPTGSDHDDTVFAIGLSGGTISLNDGAVLVVPIRMLEWLAVVPHLVTVTAPGAGNDTVEAFGFGAAIRFQTPFGSRPYRLFAEQHIGAIRGAEDKDFEGERVDTRLRVHTFGSAGVEFKVWSDLTWSLGVGTGAADLHKIHAAFGGRNFTALTGFRWYF